MVKYVADWGNRLISVFLTDGTFLQLIGKGQLGCPYDVAVTGDDKLLVVDSKHDCIYKFTLDGNYIGIFRFDMVLTSCIVQKVSLSTKITLSL